MLVVLWFLYTPTQNLRVCLSVAKHGAIGRTISYNMSVIVEGPDAHPVESLFWSLAQI